MIRDLMMAIKAWKPFTAAFEFDGDDVQLAVIVNTAGLRVNINAVDGLAMHNNFHFIVSVPGPRVYQYAHRISRP